MLLRVISIRSVLILAAFILATSLEATHHLGKRDVGGDLYVSCDQGFSMSACRQWFDTAWAGGEIQRFTTEHQFTHWGGCKFSWWTDDTNGFTKTSKQDWNYVLSRIDKVCATSPASGGNNTAVWVGEIVGQLFLPEGTDLDK
ncbi:hypothetical protein O181_083535 [Austropuccinia psidii MF-1]|uniref:Uncharacterized protein n=1 Tax=Austropuccinia psidii MF-1 TaxID=1389203 RepID=A0A9Q3ILQ6_9BASI|nr:hypothetical protein [Austropuccinia psidii MF-1]